MEYLSLIPIIEVYPLNSGSRIVGYKIDKAPEGGFLGYQTGDVVPPHHLQDFIGIAVKGNYLVTTKKPYTEKWKPRVFVDNI